MSPITNMCTDKCTFTSSCIQWQTIQAYSDNIPGVLPLCPVDLPTPMLPVLPHHHICGSLCPHYHRGPPCYTIPLSFSKSYCSFTSLLQKAFLALPLLDQSVSPYMLPESLLFLLWCIAHRICNYCHYLCWRQSNGPGRA